MKVLGKILACFLISLVTGLWLPLRFVQAQTTTTSPLTGIQSAQRSQYGTYEKAFVKEASEKTLTTSQGAEHVFEYTLEFRSGRLEGTTQKVTVQPSSLPDELKPQVGDSLIVYVQADINQNAPTVFFESYDRQTSYLWIAAILVILSLVLAGWKTLKLPLIYLLTLLLCFEIAIPLSSWNWPGWVIAIILLAVFSFFGSLLLSSKGQRPWLPMGGTVASGILGYGLLSLFTAWARLQYDGLSLLGFWLVVLAFQLDLALALSYGLSEIKKMAGNLNFKELFQMGMNVGREKLINQAPIFCLAIIGLPMALLAQEASAGYPWLKFINTGSVAQAITLPMAGLIGLILAVPIISLLAGLANLRQINRGADPLRRAISWRQDSTTDTVDQTTSVE
jgi:uncharacterized membrane protein